jgi:hypothetical protein
MVFIEFTGDKMLRMISHAAALVVLLQLTGSIPGISHCRCCYVTFLSSDLRPTMLQSGHPAGL